MPPRVRPLVLALLLCAAARAADKPELLLHAPFDGAVEPAFTAFQALRTTCVEAEFLPGRRDKAVKIGSARFPTSLKYRAPRLITKERGSVAFYYQPHWDPSNPAQQRPSRLLLTDDTRRPQLARFRVSIERGRLVVVWPGDPPTLLTMPIGQWKRGTWYHILITWDSAEGITLFLNGVKAASRLAQWSVSPSNTLIVGANHSGMEPAEGLFDELRLYDRALTKDEAEVASLEPISSSNASPIAAPAPKEPAQRAAPLPLLTLHCTFDNTLEAEQAAGSPSPIGAQGIAFGEGILGKAFLARKGAQLAYSTEKNTSKESGTLMLWARSLPDAKGGQRAFIADARKPGTDPPQASNALGLWLEGSAHPQLRFGIRPTVASVNLVRWNEGLWHHIAITWQRGRHVRIYLNGNLASTHQGRNPTWQPALSPLLYVGSVRGSAPAHAAIDDLRVYDAPLSQAQIAEQAHRAVTPMHMELRPSFCERGQPCNVVVRLFSLTDQTFSSTLTVRVFAADGKKVLERTTPVEIAPDRWIAVPLSLDAAAVGSEGVLRITTELAGKTGLPSAPLLVVAPIPREAPSDGQKSPTAKLHLVGRINPSAVSNDPTRFLRAGPSRVLQIGDKRYHEAGASRDDRIAFRFALPDAGHLYVAMVAYPDNMSRSAGIVMSTPRLPTSYDVATGHLSGDEPPTLRMQSHPIYFWPRERQGAFIFRTLEDGRPAAVANVDLFRVRGGLGASMTDTPPDGGRRIGLHWEAPAVPTQFGCLGSHPVQVYRSFHRLTDYLRFTGQNLLVYPILGVRGPLMASEYERFSGGPAIYAHCQGWLDMVLALCERRSLRFLPELLFHDSLTLRTRAGSQSEAAILAGTPTARMALWDDSISLTVPASTPLYSPSHPAFQEALLTLLDEFLTRYGKSPALEGAALRLGQRQSGWFGSIQCGYGDATIDQFEKDTKIAVPVDPASPSRFSLRARWLLTHQYDAWVRWRCTVVAALHAKLADRLHQARPGLKLILTVASPSHVTSQPLFGATSLSAERPVAQLLREAGIDLAAYAASPNIVVRHVLHPVDDAYLRYRYPDSGPLHRDGFVRDVNYLEEFTQPFRSPHGTAVAAMFRPFTPVSGALRPPKGLWWRPFGKRMTQPTQAGRAFLEPYAHALAALDTPMLSAGHSTLVTLGHEPHLHLFARAFKALPNRPFTDIHGLSDPVCGRQLQTQDSHTVYFVNRTAWPVDLAVAFTGKDVRLLDLATLDPVSLPAAKDKSLPAPMPRKFVSEHTLPAEPGPMPKLDARENVSGPLLQRQLLAYELAAYRVLGAKTEIAYATARCPEKVRHALAQRVASARQMLANAKAPPAALDAAKHTLALAERAYQKHELRRAQLLLDSNPLNQLR